MSLNDEINEDGLIEFFKKHSDKYIGYFFIAQHYGDSSDFKLNTLLFELLHKELIKIRKITERLYLKDTYYEDTEIWGYRLIKNKELNKLLKVPKLSIEELKELSHKNEEFVKEGNKPQLPPLKELMKRFDC
jgi:hypothetical protein